MKAAWDKLMEEYNGHQTALVGDADCTAEGKSLCDSVGVQGFPTIKWGSPDDLQDYKGGRGFEQLKAFADENLKPICGPSNIDLCDDAKKKEINTLMGMSDADLDSKIEEMNAKVESLEKTFKEGVEGLNAKYKELSENKGPDFEAEVDKLRATYKGLEDTKESGIKEVKDSGLGLMKAVKAAKKAGKGEL